MEKEKKKQTTKTNQRDNQPSKFEKERHGGASMIVSRNVGKRWRRRINSKHKTVVKYILVLRLVKAEAEVEVVEVLYSIS